MGLSRNQIVFSSFKNMIVVDLFIGPALMYGSYVQVLKLKINFKQKFNFLQNKDQLKKYNKHPSGYKM